MKARFQLLLLAGITALGLCGCFPEERIWWSPQGDRALVLIDDRIRLVNADGELGAPLTDAISQEQTLVQTVSWLRDGSGFVCQRVRLIPHWEEARALTSAGEVAAVDALLPAVLPLLEAAIKLSGGAKTLDEVAKALPMERSKAFGIAVRRMFQDEPGKVENLLLGLPSGADIVAALKKEGSGFPLTELCLFKLDAKLGEEPLSLVRSLLNPLLLPRVSPNHDLVAFLRLDEAEENIELEVMGLDGKTGLTVARNVSAAFDWTPDGRALVFMAPIGGEGEKLQSIHRIAVAQEDGRLLKAESRAAPATLATAVTLNRPALQVLADGRILFASHTVTLPSAGTGPEPEPRLFTISTDGGTVRAVPTTPGDLPTNLAWFAASPDGKRVAVVESETDSVAVVAVDTGKTQIISPPHPRWQSRTMPAWKSATELTFAALHEGSPAWVLWSETTGLRRLSDKWPAAATTKWLEQNSERAAQDSTVSQPATSQ